jgi:cytokinin dehydrogenase
VTWRQLLSETLPLELCPKVQPLNLDLTVGGTLSAGGLGTTSHRQGFAASHVLSAQVVLGTGELVATGPTQNRDVFDAVFGGLGRVAVMGRVELELEPAARQVETLVLRYDDCEEMLLDQVSLAANPSAYHLGGMCAAAVHGLTKAADGSRAPLRHWSYALELTLRSVGAGDEGAALEGLSYRQVLHRETDDLASFLARYDSRFQLMRATGAWQQAHPWFEALVPIAAAEATLGKLMNLPPFFGDGHRVTVVADRARPASIAYPPGGPAMVVAVLPVGVAPPYVPKALEVIAALDAHVLDVGGRRYLSGWLSRGGEFSWERHYCGEYDRIVALKKRFDPAEVFRSKLPPLY